MKLKFYVPVFISFVLALGSLAAWPQNVGQEVAGTITQEGQPLANAQLVFTSSDTGKVYKANTGKDGKFSMVGLSLGGFSLTITSESGETLYQAPQIALVGQPVAQLVLDITKEGAKQIRSVSDNAKAVKMTKEQIKAEQAKVAAMNAMITQAQTAMQTQNWAEAEKDLKQVLTENPTTTRWELYKALGDTQGRSNKLEDAIQTYQKGIEVAQAVATGAAPKDLRNPDANPAHAKVGISQMQFSTGNAYVKLGKAGDAVALFQKAAETDPNPALAYFNLCAVYYNTGKFEDAAAACDKSITANPAKADPWFFKGSALKNAGKPGSAEALNKYLEMDANGAYSAAAKSLLQKK
ncbi:MAG TPA: tetratricopeptide repeat protein [Candidatus Saccharimonadales bacterium]|jgi:tetratricopeptide (TPR) repeat protein|nr:tetratricopeptide repeat protein [Candidatus Saccharimonadales bacterium]